MAHLVFYLSVSAHNTNERNALPFMISGFKINKKESTGATHDNGGNEEDNYSFL